MNAPLRGVTAIAAAAFALLMAVPAADAKPRKPKRIGTKVVLTSASETYSPTEIQGRLRSPNSRCRAGRPVHVAIRGAEELMVTTARDGTFTLVVETTQGDWRSAGFAETGFPYTPGSYSVTTPRKKLGKARRSPICRSAKATLAVEEVAAGNNYTAQGYNPKTFTGGFTLDPPCDGLRGWALIHEIDAGAAVVNGGPLPASGEWSHDFSFGPETGKFTPVLFPAIRWEHGPGTGLTILQCAGDVAGSAGY